MVLLDVGKPYWLKQLPTNAKRTLSVSRVWSFSLCGLGRVGPILEKFLTRPEARRRNTSIIEIVLGISLIVLPIDSFRYMHNYIYQRHFLLNSVPDIKRNKFVAVRYMYRYIYKIHEYVGMHTKSNL
ncbi:hypothetical protein MKX01_002121 [Papaver californicum]|nr:hypothetical protein MKX01_002121 [Papaver californicum]